MMRQYFVQALEKLYMELDAIDLFIWKKWPRNGTAMI